MRTDDSQVREADERAAASSAIGRNGNFRVRLCCGLLMLGACGFQAVCAAGAADAPGEAAAAAAAPPMPRQPARRSHEAALNDRVQLLAAELDLDADQQARVRRILEDQRGQVRQVWNNAALTSASRIGATQAISEHTADQIRALLSEEQRRKYLESRTPRTPEDGRSSPSLDFWMDPARASR